MLDITDSIESKGTTGNTLTVCFVQRDLAGIQNLKNSNDKVCAFPYSNTLSCKIANGALHLITAPDSKLPKEMKKLEANVALLCDAEKKTGKKAKAVRLTDEQITDVLAKAMTWSLCTREALTFGVGGSPNLGI